MEDCEWEAGDLRTTLRICTLLQSVRELYVARDVASVRVVFERHVTHLVLDVIPATRAALILDGCCVPDDIDAAVIDCARRDQGGTFSLPDGRSALTAPLLVHHEMAGLIYLESDPAAPFGEQHHLLLSAVAKLASLALENAVQREWLENHVRCLEDDLQVAHAMAGTSPALASLREQIGRVAPTGTTVLITGESGTGKELVARALHQHSLRAKKPFVAINCAALTETLLESELFGHERGAFTGAVAQKRGRLECAEGGTVFLDEIGEMPPGLQAKLLRVLQQREFERVGGTRTIPLDIRLIAATNRNLEEAVRRGAFRQDLFYRLNVVSLRTPPLRERTEDILVLASQFAAKFAERCGREIRGISPEARGLLRAYSWPGNVRELENAMERAVVLGTTGQVLAEDLPDSLRAGVADPAQSPEGGILHDAVAAAKRAAVAQAFEQSSQDHNEAARLLGVHPNYLYRLVRALEVPSGKQKHAAHG